MSIGKVEYVELPAIKETSEDYDELEREILEAFKRELYFPLLEIIDLPRNRLANANEGPLKSALKQGRVTFYRGTFSGRFNAQISRELRALGAQWDKKTSTYKINLSQLPQDIQQTIKASTDAFNKTLNRIDEKIRQIVPAKIADKVNSADFFDKAIWKIDGKIDNTLRAITVLPKLSPENRRKIAEEWRDNMNLWIKNFSEEHIKELRDTVQAHAEKGGRYEDLVKVLQRSYNVTYNKAKFWAQQETSLLMTKFKETRYVEAGIEEYRWGCVVGSPNHPVRPSHKILEGQIFRWDNPPITTPPNEPARRNNPGQDYRCRCFARPVYKRIVT